MARQLTMTWAKRAIIRLCVNEALYNIADRNAVVERLKKIEATIEAYEEELRFGAVKCSEIRH
jgi:hypothetical protein